MKQLKMIKFIGIVGIAVLIASCNSTKLIQRDENTSTPETYVGATGDTLNSARLKWKEFFTDPYLVALIDTALKNNQELNMMWMEIRVAQNEVGARKGEYLPFVGAGLGGGVDKKARYTALGASEATTEIEPGKEMPEPVPDLGLVVHANWEIDIWRKLRNAKDAAAKRYLATVEGKNFMVTELIAEIANSYYELLALDNQLQIVRQNIEIQSNALEIVKLQKQSARVTELAVRKFEAEVFSTRSLQYGIQQKIVETENRINFLLGRFPQPIPRSSDVFSTLVPASVQSGIPSQLLQNRPDIRQAELELSAARLDVKVAKAEFYPSLTIRAGVGVQAFNPAYLIKSPQSILYNVIGDLVAPLINRKAIKAKYSSANAKQVQAVFNYEKTILTAFLEVSNQVSNISNLEQSYNLKQQQVQALTESIDISSDLFRSARADYMEVLLTQRDALESRFELVETKKQQLNAVVNIYRALGGGWY